MQNLQQYVDQKNRWETLFGHPALDLNVAQDRQRIANAIDCDLSPENLSCDGELSIAQIRARYQTLTKAADELKALDPTINFMEY
jgi:hypothetical protein